ncbi:MAG: hypothetical protein Q8R55_03495 [Candidatus Taylorbacteria bacterium]|nr:hypothetical protein [Candidatus Taylorbacteria bacterium]
MTSDPYNLDIFYLWGKAQILAGNFDVGPVLDVLKMIGLLLTLIFGVLLMWVIFRSKERISDRTEEIKMELNPPKAGEGKYDARWKEVREHLTSLREAEWKFAIIEADKIMEAALEGAGFPGETIGERMTLIDKENLNSINDLWQAHKLRNIIAHDPHYTVKYGEVRQAIENYEKALRELGVLG